MKDESFVEITNSVYTIVFLIFIIVGAIFIIQINNSLAEQNAILKDLVVACQNQADAIKEQNKILTYNPAEDK